MSKFRTSFSHLLHVIIVVLWVATGAIAPCLCSHDHTDELLEQAVTVSCTQCEPEPIPACCANEASAKNSKASQTGTNSSPLSKACQHTSERLNVGHLTSASTLPLPDVNDNTLSLFVTDQFDCTSCLHVDAPFTPKILGNAAPSALYGRTLPLLS